ncbi:MAG: zf-HC2 domain-containing protein [Lentisphaeria bacterium]|jgi:hypothetical protein|nr:zf-HC2 domain-containing protein [Lentisphaeria bacterium]
MNNSAASPGCPDPETISAFFDGELSPDESLRAHLDSCPDCTGRLADYAVLREHLSRAAASEPDSGMNARIAAFVRAESAGLAPAALHERDFSNSRTAWILRIAALFLLGGFFVYLLLDQMHVNHARNGGFRTASSGVAHGSAKPLPALEAEPGTGDYVRARLVSNSPSARQYAIDIDPALVPDEYDGIPGDGRIPILLPSDSSSAEDLMRRIPLHLDPAFDAMRMLESIRRDLTALDVPGLSVDTESRGNSLFTTIRLDSAGMFDMSMTRTDDAFELFLLSGDDAKDDDGPLVFHIEFFCE